jgi:hypothetical protein
MEWTPFSYPFNLTQQPAASVPCGLAANGLPVGLHVVGARFADEQVLRGMPGVCQGVPDPAFASTAYAHLKRDHLQEPADRLRLQVAAGLGFDIGALQRLLTINLEQEVGATITVQVNLQRGLMGLSVVLQNGLSTFTGKPADEPHGFSAMSRLGADSTPCSASSTTETSRSST